MPKTLTIEEIRDFFEKEDKEKKCELLSTEYVNNRTKLKFRCNLCGEIYYRDFSHEKNKKRFCCQKCSRHFGNKTFSIIDVKDFLIENDTKKECELLSERYESFTKPLLFKCNICGNNFYRDFAHIKRKRFCCPKCAIVSGAKTLKYTEEMVDSIIEEKGFIRTGKYVNAFTEFSATCKR